MDKNSLLNKTLVLGVSILFLALAITPTVTCGKISEIHCLESCDTNQDTSSVTFYTFDKTEEKQIDVNLPIDAANNIYNILEELKYMIVHEPRSDETQALKIEFVDLLDTYGLIPSGLTKSDVLSLLNPSWLNNKQKTPKTRINAPFLKSFVSCIAEKIFYLRQIFKNHFGKTVFNNFDKNNIILPSSTITGTATFCSISSGGNGATLPLFLLPRPRGIAIWTASSAVTMVGELLTTKGFIAEGAQSGTMLGFTGMGLTYAFPGSTMYGFVGYALYTKVSADHIEFYPPNHEPVISDENPSSGTEDIPVSLSELSFRISDSDGDRMDYTVTTEPNIGSGSGDNKQSGVYTVPVSNVEADKLYSWTVEVTDGNFVVEKVFNFITVSGPPFDPFDEGWQYRKKITVNHLQVAGDLTYFPVLISVTDVDLRDKAQDDGDDISFMDGSGVATKLYHEIEIFDDSSGKLIAWVKLPSLSSTVDLDIYMYYGNPGCSSQQFAEKVWDSSYCGVWHLNYFFDSRLHPEMS